MNKRVLLFIGLFIGLPQLGACSDGTSAAVETVAIDYSAVVNELPWMFDIDTEEITGYEQEGEPASRTVRYDFVSKDPIKKTPGGGLYLKVDLNVTEYKQSASASNVWESLVEKAHPDMGLSYEWDHLIYKDRTIYHLHAACTFSEGSFDVMNFNLRSIVVPEQHNVAPTIHCRCGGGCIVSGQENFSSEQQNQSL